MRSASARRSSGSRAGGMGFSIVMQRAGECGGAAKQQVPHRRFAPVRNDKVFELGFYWGFAGLAQADDLIQDALRDLPLCCFGNFDYFVARDDGDSVAVGVEAYAFARRSEEHTSELQSP